MNPKKDHPGVYPPPPLFYVATFFLSLFIQYLFPLSRTLLGYGITRYLAAIFITLGGLSILPALVTFFRTKNTLVTIKPATSLQTKGIYSISRNPMYVGLLLIYTGIALLKGNLWTFLLIPVVILVVTQFVIIREEKYLERAFGQPYLDYKARVRRWL